MSTGFIDSILGFGFLRTSKKVEVDLPKEIGAIGPSTQVSGKYFLDANEILSRTQCAYCVTQIKEIAGLSDEAFNEYYLPALNNIAVLCQDIGASERYHHANEFGLIEHTLEVAMYAMRRSQGCVYFPDGSVENIQWLERVFMYAVFCAAILHDGGKVFTNTRWRVLNDSGEWVLWSPLIHKIPQGNERVQYRTESLRNSANKNIYLKHSHEIFASHLLLEVIPRKGLDWILNFSYQYGQELYLHFLHALASDYENASDVGLCVKLADQKSTEAAVKRYHASSASHSSYVDLADPNLPLHESFNQVFKEIFSDPGSFHLQVNKVAMGKFSHIERFGNLLFVVAKSVLPIVVRKLKEKNIKLPNDQAIFTLLADNGLSLTAPSGDTLWWVEFFSKNNHNKSKEMCYLVFNLSNFPDTEIKDLSEIGVQCNLSVKSLGDMEIKSSSEETLAANEYLFNLFYPRGRINDASSLVDNEGKDETDCSTSNLPQEITKSTSSRVELVAPTPNEDDKLTSNPITAKSSMTADEQETSARKRAERKSNDPIKADPALTTVRGPRQKNVSAKQDKSDGVDGKPKSLTTIGARTVTPAEDTPAVREPISAGKAGNDGQKTNSSNRKKASVNHKKASNFAVGLDKAMGGLSFTDNSKPKKNHQSEPPKVAKQVAPIHMDESTPSITCEMPPVTPETDKVMSEEFVQTKINVWPVALELPNDKLDDLMRSKIPKSITLFSSEDASKKSEEIHTRWLPYLSELVEKGIILVNHPNGAVIHSELGVFIAQEPLREIIDGQICDHMFDVFLNSALAISKDGTSTLHTFTTIDNKVLSGVLLATRHILVAGKRLPIVRDVIR